MTRPVYLLRLRGGHSSHTDVHTLRFVLKALLRRHHLRCIGAREVRSRRIRASTPPPARVVLSPAAKQTEQLETKEYEMSDLSLFRQSASRMRSGEGRAFDGDFVTFNGESGGWKSGKNKTLIDGRQLVADIYDLIVGWQAYRDDKFIYAGHGLARDNHEPPPREQLDENDKRFWRNPQDPWRLTYYLALHDPATREQFIFSTSSGGGKDALANLQEAFADHNEKAAPEDYEWPFVELASDHYVNTYGKKIFKPIFETVDWVKPPPAFRLPKPPAATAIMVTDFTRRPALEHLAEEWPPKPTTADPPVEKAVSTKSDESAPKTAKAVTKPAPRKKPDMDDEIPF